jgi:hypothetical protein
MHGRARQFLFRIQKWGLDKNNKPHEAVFMAQKQHHRRTHEPEKGDYVFRLRGQIVPPRKNERFEFRMKTAQGQAAASPEPNLVLSPQSIPGKPFSRSKPHRTP